jgi:hypothetical protein
MTFSLHTTIRRSGLVLVAATGLATILAGSALAGNRPAASFYTKAQLETISQSWAARGGVFTNRPAASYYTPAQLETISQSWAARGGVFTNRPAASYYTPAQLETMSQSWAARGGHFAVSPGATLTSKSGFDWGDFGIGAGAMLGLVLLAGGIAAGAHYSRKSGVGVRPAS